MPETVWSGFSAVTAGIQSDRALTQIVIIVLNN